MSQAHNNTKGKEMAKTTTETRRVYKLNTRTGEWSWVQVAPKYATHKTGILANVAQLLDDIFNGIAGLLG